MINTHAQPAKFKRSSKESFNQFRHRLKLSDIITMSSPNEPSHKANNMHNTGLVISESEFERIRLTLTRAPNSCKTQTLRDLAPTIKAKHNDDTVVGISFSALRKHYKNYIEAFENEKN